MTRRRTAATPFLEAEFALARSQANIADILGRQEIARLNHICEGCGDETSNEYELCRACDSEREAESAADQRADR